MAPKIQRSFINAEIIADVRGVQRMLTITNSALSPSALMYFLGFKVGPYLAKRADARFKSEGDDVSGPWAPLQPATMEARRIGREQGLWSVGDDHPINVRTHELENYITQGVGVTFPLGGGGARLQFPKVSGKPSIRSKMKTAQRGGMAPGATHPTPARPVIGLNEQDLTFVLVELALHVKGAALVGPGSSWGSGGMVNDEIDF